jgi:hypothetical protein
MFHGKIHGFPDKKKKGSGFAVANKYESCQ